MATHSSNLAWRIPWIEESCGLQCIGLQYNIMYETSRQSRFDARYWIVFISFSSLIAIVKASKTMLNNSSFLYVATYISLHFPVLFCF